MSSDVRPIRPPAHKPAHNSPIPRHWSVVATNGRKGARIRSSRVQLEGHNLRFVFRGMERLLAQPVERYPPEMEQTMSIRNILMTTAALALLTPLIAPTASFAQNRGPAGNIAAGVAAGPRSMGTAAPAAAAPAPRASVAPAG